MSVRQMILLIGASGDGKTSVAATMATGLYRETGLRTRIYNGDGGIASAHHLVAAGIADIWEVSRATYPFELLVDITQGYWPEDVNDPYSRRHSPFLVRYKAVCDKCKKALYDAEKPYAGPPITCPTDKVPVRIDTLREPNPKNDISKVGLIVYEGLTAFGEMFLDNMSDRSARGEKIGEDVAVRFDDNTVKVGAVSRSSYGIGQRRLKRAVDDSRLLTVPYVIWTALKDRGEDSERRVPVFGPKLPGHAAADDAPRWFGPTLQLSRWPAATGEERRVYLKPFRETFNKITGDVEHICNSRIPAIALDGIPDYEVYKPQDETLLWRIVRTIEERQAKAAELAKAPAKEGKK